MSASTPHVLRFTLDLGAPAVFTTRASGEWLVASDGYVPGSALAGAASAAWLTERRLPLGLVHHGAGPEVEEYRRLFVDGRTAFLNAYPVDPLDDTRLLLAPLSLHEDRDTGTIHDLVAGPSDGAETRPFGAGRFVRLAGKTLVSVEVARSLHYHTGRERLAGRSTKAHPAFFTYEALEPEQRFAGAIVGERGDLATLKQLLDRTTLELGRSRSAGYGADALFLSEQVREFVPEHDGHGNAGAAAGTLVLTLTAPLAARDPAAGAYGDFPFGELAERLAPLGAAIAEDDLRAACRQRFTREVVVGGFLRGWVLPRPQWRALAAGSVFVFDGLALDDAQRRAAQATGLGERLADGHGRFVLDWHGRESTLDLLAATRREAAAPAGPTPAGYREIVRRAALDAYERALRDDARRLVVRPRPTNALASRIALLLREQPTTVAGSFEASSRLRTLRATTARQLDDALVKGVALRAYLIDALAAPARILADLRDPGDLGAALRSAGGSLGPDDEHQLVRAHLVELMTAIRKAPR